MTVIRTRITQINVSVNILHVHNPTVDYRQQLFYNTFIHIKRCLNIYAPSSSAYIPETADKSGMQQRFAATEGDAAARSREIQAVNLHLLIKRLRRIPHTSVLITPALGIKTIPARQRTAVKGRQSGHALTVSGESVTRYTDKRQKTICIHTEKPDAIRRTLSICKSNILHTDTQIKGIKKR